MSASSFENDEGTPSGKTANESRYRFLTGWIRKPGSFPYRFVERQDELCGGTYISIQSLVSFPLSEAWERPKGKELPFHDGRG